MSEESTTLELDRYTSLARGLVAAAQNLADERHHARVEPIHLLARAIDRVPGVVDVVRRCGADPNDVLAAAQDALERLPKSRGEVAYLSNRFQELLRRAEGEARRENAKEVDVAHLLNALSQEIRGAAGDVLVQFDLGPGVFRPYTHLLEEARKRAEKRQASAAPVTAQGALAAYTRDLLQRVRKEQLDPVIGRDAEVRRLLQVIERRRKNHPLLVGEAGVGKTSLVRALAARVAAGDVPPNLSDLSMLELDTGALVAGARLRGELEQRVRGLLSGLEEMSTHAEVVLVVENFESLLGHGVVGSGVGDMLEPALGRSGVRFLGTTTPEGLRKIQDRNPGLLRRLTVLQVEPPTVEQATEMLRGVATRYEKHHNVKIGEPAVVAAVRLAKRYLQDRTLPDSAIDLLDETAARKRVETEGVPAELDTLMRRIESLRAQEATLADDDDEASVAMKKKLAAEREQLEPKVEEAKKSIESRRGAVAAAQLLRKELQQAREKFETARKEKRFAELGELEHVTIPDLERRLAAAEAAVQRVAGVEVSNDVTDQDVAETLGAWTGIPVAKMLEEDTAKLLRMEERLRGRVVGQDDALLAVSKAVRRGRVGLRDPKRPIGSFLFLGPSGVGKTELAKALAAFLFDDEQALTRLDMSEFMEKHMAQRLLGAPPGYVDSEQGGFLTEAVRRRPYSVLLFDEVEKAHPDVFNLLLQLLDDGRLTDGRGRTADFSNTVVIMTSNIGAKRILETSTEVLSTEDGMDALEDVLMDELRSFFRPEFLNRIGDVVVFRTLSKDTLLGVVDIQLRKLQQLLADREITIEMTDEAKKLVVELGYEPALGARPVQRVMLRELQDPLAESLLKGGYERGDTVRVGVKDGSFSFEKISAGS